MPTADSSEEFQSALGDEPTDNAPIAGMASAGDDEDHGDEPAVDETRPTRGAIKASTRAFAAKIAAAHKGRLESGAFDVGLSPVIGGAATAQGAAPSESTATTKPPPEPAGAPAGASQGPTPDQVAAWEAINASKAELALQQEELKAVRARTDRLVRGKLLGSGDDIHGAMTALVRDELGDGASDADVAEALGDVVTELSLRIAGVTLPASAQQNAKTRQALRLLDRHNREQAKRETEAKGNAEREEQRRNRLNTADQIGKEIDKTPDAYRFLKATSDADRDGMSPGEFITAVIEERWKHDRTKLSWSEAATLANKHFETEARRQHERLAPLFTAPNAGGGAAPAGGAPQGDRSATQVPRTLRNADASESQVPSEPEPQGRFDPDEHRRRTASKWNGKLGRKLAE